MSLLVLPRRGILPALAHTTKILSPRYATLKLSGPRQISQASISRPRSPSPIFTGILCVGIAVTAYGAYTIYDTLTMWPQEVRKDLRDGLAAKHKGDLKLSEQYLMRAWESAKALPIEKFSAQPHLKISGIAVCLADILEAENKLERAYEIYAEALTWLQIVEGKEDLSGSEKLRTVAISYKLGEMAKELRKPLDIEEGWLALAVEYILKAVLTDSDTAPQQNGKSRIKFDQSLSRDSDSQVMIADLKLPEWVTKMDIAAPLESLGAFYARNGRIEYAMALYLQAISLLIPPSPQQSSVEDRCRGAQLMSGLSELIMRSEPTPEIRHQAEAWVSKSLEILTSLRNSKEKSLICDYAFAAALLNAGILREMDDDNHKAREYFKLSLDHSKAIEMQEGIDESEEALRRLNEMPAKEIS